jgi:hypothetical protein
MDGLRETRTHLNAISNAIDSILLQKPACWFKEKDVHTSFLLRDKQVLRIRYQVEYIMMSTLYGLVVRGNF